MTFIYQPLKILMHTKESSSAREADGLQGLTYILIRHLPNGIQIALGQREAQSAQVCSSRHCEAALPNAMFREQSVKPDPAHAPNSRRCELCAWENVFKATTVFPAVNTPPWEIFPCHYKNNFEMIVQICSLIHPFWYFRPKLKNVLEHTV